MTPTPPGDGPTPRGPSRRIWFLLSLVLLLPLIPFFARRSPTAPTAPDASAAETATAAPRTASTPVRVTRARPSAPRTTTRAIVPAIPRATVSPVAAATPAPSPAPVTAIAPIAPASPLTTGAIVRSAPTARDLAMLMEGREAVVLAPRRPYPSAEPNALRSLFVPVPDSIIARGGTFAFVDQGPWRTLGARSGVLERGATAPIAFTLMVPALAAAGETPVGVVRFVPDGGGAYYDVPLWVTVATRTQVSLEAGQPIVGARSGDRVRTHWTIRNAGNADVEVSLRFTTASGWRARAIAGDAIRVARGDAVSVPVDIDVPNSTGTGDFSVVGTVRTRSGATARDEQGWLVSGSEGRGGEGGLANVRLGTVQDDAGRTVQGYGVDWLMPLRSDLRFSGRVGGVSSFGSPLAATALGGLGFADRVGQVELRASTWSLGAGNVGIRNAGLSGFGLYGDGAVGSLAGRDWRGDVAAVQPVRGDGRYLFGRAQRRVGRAWLGVMASDLADDFFVDRQARSVAADAAVPTPLGALEVQAGVRQTSFGDGASLQLALGRRLETWGYSLSAGRAPGGAAAFAAAENTWAVDAFRDLGERVTVVGSLWGNDDQARADRRFRAAGWSSRGTWRVRPTLNLDAELRESAWESETPFGGVANGDRTVTVGAALARGTWQWRGGARAGTVRREADLLALGRVTTVADQAAVNLQVRRAFDAATVSATASTERTGPGVGLPAQLSSLEFRADRLPLWSRRAHAYAEYGIVLLGASGSRLDAQTVGVDLQLPLELGVTLEASRNALFRRAGTGSTPWVVALRVQRGLALPGGGGERVLGRVFLDANANGRLDRGERGLPGIIVQVEDVPVSTDGEGRYRGAPGAHAVVDVRSLPAGLLVAPRAADAHTGEIAIVSTAPVLLRVVVENPDQVPMRPVDLARAVVILRDAQGRMWSNAVGPDGLVRFDALPLGRYRVEVETSAVGEPLYPLQTVPEVEVTARRAEGPITLILVPRPMRVQPVPAPRRVRLEGRQVGAAPE